MLLTDVRVGSHIFFLITFIAKNRASTIFHNILIHFFQKKKKKIKTNIIDILRTFLLPQQGVFLNHFFFQSLV